MFYSVVLIVLLILLVAWRAFQVAKHPTHAGGVVYRVNNGAKEYLLVTASKNRNRWVLPKGHIEAGETEHEAAKREVAEEAGINATIVKKLGNTVHIKNLLVPINVAFFLMEYRDKVASPEKRQQRWLPIDEAITTASLSPQQHVLRAIAGAE
jgi:8-oxo-dGTP pyrophosphatase MutT (NUDIX family)